MDQNGEQRSGAQGVDPKRRKPVHQAWPALAPCQHDREVAQRKSAENRSDTNAHHEFFAEPAYHRRPYEIELLLDRQAPIVTQVRHKAQTKGGGQVREVEPEPDLIFNRRSMHQDRREQDQVIERKNAQCSPRIEDSIVILRVLGAQQNTGNQVSRENEKEIDANPTTQSDSM